MFKLNTLQRTVDGKLLMPLVINGDVVTCVDSKKNTLYRKLSDFDFTPPPKEKPVFSVMAKEELNDDALFKEEVVENELTEISGGADTGIIDNSGVTDTPIDNGDSGDSGTSPTPDPDPVVDNPDPPSGSIWDTVNDDDYI